MEGLYKAFLDAGYSPSLYWELGILEIIDMIKSRIRCMEYEQEKENIKTKNMIMLLWNQNRQLIDLSGCLFKSEHEPAGISDYYPGLFDDALKLSEDEQQKINCELHKARMEEYAYYHNRARRERGENNERIQRINTGASEGNHRSTDEPVHTGYAECAETDHGNNIHSKAADRPD